MALTLTADERTELERRVRSLKIRSDDARRARVILMLANGDSYSTIEATVPCFRDYINRWRRRFLADRIDGLQPRYRGQAPTVLTPAMEARVLEKTRQAPPDGSTHWSTRKLGRVLKIHHNLVAKAWRRAGLQPHRFERYMESDDPDFEPKAADVIGLYVNPPDQHRGGGSVGPDRASAYQRRFCRAPRRHCGQPTEETRDPRHCRQFVDSQNASGSHVSDRSSQREDSLHSDVFIVAEPGRTLVLED